jgi:acyl-CoA thioesterase FadM
MYVWVRLARVGIGALCKKRLGFLDESIVRFVVCPQDLDAYLHMNNGRYLSIMDLGRLDLMIRNGILKICLKRRWQPVVAGVTIRYNRPLSPLAHFHLHTQLIGWKEKWLYLEETFKRTGSEVARATVRMAVLDSGNKKVPIGELAEAAGHFDGSPPLSQEGCSRTGPKHKV